MNDFESGTTTSFVDVVSYENIDILKVVFLRGLEVGELSNLQRILTTTFFLPDDSNENVNVGARLQNIPSGQKNPALAQILKTNNQLAKTVTKRAREKALETDLAEFAKLKDNGDLRGAYRHLKVTLRSINISWFERGRKSVGPSKQDFCRHNSELFMA